MQWEKIPSDLEEITVINPGKIMWNHDFGIVFSSLFFFLSKIKILHQYVFVVVVAFYSI